MRWGYIAILLLVLPGVSALVEDCGPDYNFGRPHRYSVVELEDDLYCPYAFFAAAVWIHDADGLVLDCKGHEIRGNGIPSLLVENTENLTLANCRLGGGIEYVNSTEARIVDAEDASAYLGPVPPNTTLIPPVEENLFSSVKERAPVPETAEAPLDAVPPDEPAPPANRTGANSTTTPQGTGPARSTFALIALVVLLVILIVALVFLLRRPGKGRKRALLLVALFAASALLAVLPTEAACSGTACDFTSSSCGTEVSGCVNQCSGTASCASIGTSGACAKMGCTWAPTTCTGTHEACSNYALQAECESHACIYDAAYCDCGPYTRVTCLSYSCNWIPAVCSDPPHTCASHAGDATGCTDAGCTNGGYACGGSPSQSCSSFYWRGDSDCYTCTDLGCSYGTQCAQGSTSCGYGTASCAAMACSSCPVGGCLKDNSCSCTSSGQCNSGYCQNAYGGGTDYCCTSTQCAENGCVIGGSFGSSCSDTSNAWYCSAGSWGQWYCGTDDCANDCQIRDYRCSGGTCGADVINANAYKVCSGASNVDASSAGTSCDGDSNYQDCSDGACSGSLRYSECNGAGSCDTAASTYYQSGSTVYAGASYTLTSTCDTTGTTLCGYSGYNACAGAGSPYACERSRDQLRCNGAGTCNSDVGNDYADVASGYVCTGSGTQTIGSATYYSATGDSGACTAPSSPQTGFGDEGKNYYACDGAGGATGPLVATGSSDCGTGCCLDAGASTSCVASGSTASNFYDFGSGDSTAVDYCVSAVVKDCSSGSAQCSSVSYTCQYGNCMAASGRIIVQTGTTDLAIFDQYGRIITRGSVYASTATSPPAGSWQITNAAGTPMAWVTTAGHLYLKGTVSERQGSVAPSGNNDFIIQNSAGSPVAYIDGATGNLYTLSTVAASQIS